MIKQATLDLIKVSRRLHAYGYRFKEVKDGFVWVSPDNNSGHAHALTQAIKDALLDHAAGDNA